MYSGIAFLADYMQGLQTTAQSQYIDRNFNGV